MTLIRDRKGERALGATIRGSVERECHQHAFPADRPRMSLRILKTSGCVKHVHGMPLGIPPT
jgi:hypothetical protein